MASIFSRIVKGEIPCYKIAEDDRYLAFLDINPLRAGHTLVITKKEVDYIFDLDDDTLAGLTLFARRVAAGIEKVIDCKRISIAVVGLDVPHVHIHLVPMDTMDDLNFSRPKLKLTPEEFKDIAGRISSNVIL
jgi:histidine triad (HIT) family protein